METSRRAWVSLLVRGAAAGVCLGTGSILRAADPIGDLEWHVWFLSNQQRSWRRLPALERNEALAAIAREHSADMLRRGYFDHRSPEGLRPVDRVVRQGVHLQCCSENLYSIRYGPEDPVEMATRVVNGWMDNPGHRENILSPLFSFVGVGVASIDRNVMITQLFGA